MSVNTTPFTYIAGAAQLATFQAFGQTLDTSSTSVIFIIDISGTMAWTYGTFFDRFGAQVINGTRLQLAQDRIAAAIDGLQGGFDFNVVAYDCSPFEWRPTMMTATPGNKAMAISFVNGLTPSGSSDTGAAGAYALDLDTDNRTLVLVSDGSPTCGPTSQAAHLCEILTANNTRGAQVHTFSIQGFGDFITFMQDMATLTGGTYGVAN